MKQVPLSRGLFALVDDEDFDRVMQFKWSASLESRGTKFYAVRFQEIAGVKVKIRMHRFILGLGTGREDPCVVDHLNHFSLDNRKLNLEVTTQRTNMLRSPGWKRKRSKCICHMCDGECTA